MLKINSNKKDLENRVRKILDDFDLEKVDLQHFEVKIINLLEKMIKSSINIVLPHEPNDYDLYNKKKKIVLNRINSSFSFEYNFIDFAEEFFKIEEHEIKADNTHIIFYIKESEEGIEELRSLLNIKKTGAFVFCVRKINNHWEIPLKGYMFSDTLESIEEVLLFENLYFDLKINNKDEIIDKAEREYRDYLSNKIKDYSVIVFNNEERLCSKDGIEYIPSSFLSKKTKLDQMYQPQRILKNKKMYFNYNLLYNKSIKLKP